MKKPLHFFLLLFCSTILPAQQINWAYNVPSPMGKTNIAVDRASNLYIYQSIELFHPDEREGSTINKYSPEGQLVFSKQWKGRFYISSMLNDGAGSFYFCGSFKGAVNTNGISMNSQGARDAFIGKIDEEGNVAWAIGFGGAKEDMANDITFNTDSTSILVTGGVDSTVFIYGYPVETTTKAIFVARFSLTGGLHSFRTYVFTPREYGENIGLEIKTNGGAGYYLLADRKGDHWSNETHPTGSPMEGRYIFSLNQGLDILWSRFIISSGCYYGYSCRNISVQEGFACVPSFCSGKYGGTGRLQKFNAPVGDPAWSITNNDGSYYDTHVSGNDLLYVGNEEANGCPCEDNNPGFGRVKILSEQNEDRVLFSKYGFHFLNITQAPNGNIYVFGETSTDDPHLEGKPLDQGHFIFSMQNPSDSYRTSQPVAGLLSAYPNPSSGYVEILNEKMIEELIITDGSGVIVRQINPEAKVYTIRDLNPGYYLVRLKDAEGYRSGKLLVAK